MLPLVLQHYRQAAEPGFQWRQTQEYEGRPAQVRYISTLYFADCVSIWMTDLDATFTVVSDISSF